MIKLSHADFTTDIVKRINNSNVNIYNLDIATATILVSVNQYSNGKFTFNCIFCEKPYFSEKYFKAEN